MPAGPIDALATAPPALVLAAGKTGPAACFPYIKVQQKPPPGPGQAGVFEFFQASSAL